MKKIKKTAQERLQLLNETVQYYSENPLRRCKSVATTLCFYDGESNNLVKSEGCAIGRLIPKELAKQFDEGSKYGKAMVGVKQIYEFLPIDVQAYGKKFLHHLQMLHDHSFNWDKNGMTEVGQENLSKMMVKFKLNDI